MLKGILFLFFAISLYILICNNLRVVTRNEAEHVEARKLSHQLPLRSFWDIIIFALSNLNHYQMYKNELKKLGYGNRKLPHNILNDFYQ